MTIQEIRQNIWESNVGVREANRRVMLAERSLEEAETTLEEAEKALKEFQANCPHTNMPGLLVFTEIAPGLRLFHYNGKRCPDCDFDGELTGLKLPPRISMDSDERFVREIADIWD